MSYKIFIIILKIKTLISIYFLHTFSFATTKLVSSTGSEVFLSAGVCTSWCFPVELMTSKLTYQLISDTGSSARPFSPSTAILRKYWGYFVNCSRELPLETIVCHVYHTMLRLQYRGYDQKFRTKAARSAMKACNRMVELDASGEQPFYRPRELKRLEWAQERREKGEPWNKKGGFDTVIFVPATPGSHLKNQDMGEIKGACFKIRVVE